MEVAKETYSRLKPRKFSLVRHQGRLPHTKSSKNRDGRCLLSQEDLTVRSCAKARYGTAHVAPLLGKDDKMRVILTY